MAVGLGTRLGTTDKNRVRSAGTVCRWQRRSTPQEVDLHQVHRAPQEVRSLVQILSPVIAGTLVRRAQNLDDGDQLAALAIANLQERFTLDVQLGQNDVGGRLENHRALSRRADIPSMSHRKVGTAHAAAGFRREIVQVHVFVNQDDVTRENLRTDTPPPPE